MKILIVEDEKMNLNTMSMMFKTYGYEVHTADNGKTGVEKAIEVRPDLILMDMNMPVMDGYEAVRILRRQGYMGQIAALTAKMDQSRMMKAGCNHIFQKPPLPIEDFLNAVKNIIRYGTAQNMTMEEAGITGILH